MIKKGQNTLLLLGAAMLVVVFLIISIVLIIRSKNSSTKILPINKESSNDSNKDSKPERITFYTSEMFGYKVEYPNSLVVRELGSGGGYIDFVRFEEKNEDATFKGFAIGVSEQTFTNEISRIKKIFEEEEALLAEESEINLLGLKARRLYYKPQKNEGGEDRTIAIFSSGQYTYSISTVPWQVDEVLSRFELQY